MNPPSASSPVMIGKWLFSGLFVVAGISHFYRPEVYLRIVPPLLPYPKLIVQLSGAAEIFLGLLLLIPAWTELAAWGLIALLVAVFPANIFMTMHPDRFAGISVWLLWARLPLQGLLIAWACRYTKR